MMNERMLELYKQAQVPHTAIDPSNNMPYETTCFSAEKFAGLIVKECIDILPEKVKIHDIYDGIILVQCGQAIKNHFGVEE